MSQFNVRTDAFEAVTCLMTQRLRHRMATKSNADSHDVRQGDLGVMVAIIESLLRGGSDGNRGCS